MIGLHRPVFGRDRRSLDQRQQVTLHTLARHVCAHSSFPPGDLVDLVEEHNAVLLDRLDGLEHQLVAVEELVRLLIEQNVVGFPPLPPPTFRPPPAALPYYIPPP